MSDLFFAQLEEGPQQARSRERLERAFVAAEALLIERGLEQTSIPEVAIRSEVPRAAIYRYFPDKYALFSAMSAAYLEKLANALTVAGEGTKGETRATIIEHATMQAAEFYNANPVASILIFHGPHDSRDRTVHQRKNMALVTALRSWMSEAPPDDAIALTIEIVFACLKFGYLRDGHVSDHIAREAVKAANGYLDAA